MKPPPPFPTSIRAALLAMPDTRGSKAIIAGINVERTGVDGFYLEGGSGLAGGGLGGSLEWAIREIDRRAHKGLP